MSLGEGAVRFGKQAIDREVICAPARQVRRPAWGIEVLPGGSAWGPQEFATSLQGQYHLLKCLILLVPQR
jgi:hypothetical protein